MFRPQLGVSLHTLSSELTAGELKAIGRSRIATIEVMARLFDDAARRDRIPVLTEMLDQSRIRPMTVHALFGSAYDISVLNERAHRQALVGHLVCRPPFLNLGLSAPNGTLGVGSRAA